MRELYIARRLARLNVLRRRAEPDSPRNTTKRKRQTGSYSDVMNLPSAGGADLNAGGQIVWMMDYDVLP